MGNDTVEQRPPATEPWPENGTSHKRPASYWVVLAGAVVGGAVIAFLLAMGAYVGFATKQPAYGLAFAVAAILCFATPVLIVWWTMEKLLKVTETWDDE